MSLPLLGSSLTLQYRRRRGLAANDMRPAPPGRLRPKSPAAPNPIKSSDHQATGYALITQRKGLHILGGISLSSMTMCVGTYVSPAVSSPQTYVKSVKVKSHRKSSSDSRHELSIVSLPRRNAVQPRRMLYLRPAS